MRRRPGNDSLKTIRGSDLARRGVSRWLAAIPTMGRPIMRRIFSCILAAVVLTVLSSAPALPKTAKACNAEYSMRKAELQAAGTRKSEFLASCETTAAAAAAPASDTNPYQQQYLIDRRVCPPDTHAEVSAGSANGSWCVLN